MPSKKPNKVAKRPGKAAPKKPAHKTAAPKKVLRPPTKTKPSPPTPKVTVKPDKPAPKPTVAKPMPSKPVAAKVTRPKTEKAPTHHHNENKKKTGQHITST